MAALADLRSVASSSDRAFTTVARLLAAAVVDGDDLWIGGQRLAVGHLREAVGKEFLVSGLTQPEGNLIATGWGSAEPHCVGDDHATIKASDPLVVDLFPKGEVFSDCTRTFCTRPTAELTEAAALVASVKELAVEAIEGALVKEGSADGYAIHELVCLEFRRHGWPTQLDLYDQLESTEITDEAPLESQGSGVHKQFVMERGYVHGLGHGVGEELHQTPSFHQRAHGTEEGRLVNGQVITIEPGLYEPQRWGVRFEDTYLIDQNCLIPITRLPWALDPKRFLSMVANQ